MRGITCDEGEAWEGGCNMFDTSAGLACVHLCMHPQLGPQGLLGLLVSTCAPLTGTPEVFAYLLVCMERSGMRTDMRIASVMSMYRRWESPGGRRTRKTLPCSQSRKVFSSVHLT